MRVFGTKQTAQPAEDVVAVERLRAIASRFKPERSPELDEAEPDVASEGEDDPQ